MPWNPESTAVFTCLRPFDRSLPLQRSPVPVPVHRRTGGDDRHILHLSRHKIRKTGRNSLSAEEDIWLPQPFIDYTPFVVNLQEVFSVFPIKNSRNSKAVFSLPVLVFLHRKDETFSPKVVIIAQTAGLSLAKTPPAAEHFCSSQAALLIFQGSAYFRLKFRVKIRVIPEAGHDLSAILQDRIGVLKVSSQTTVLGLDSPAVLSCVIL